MTVIFQSQRPVDEVLENRQACNGNLNSYPLALVNPKQPVQIRPLWGKSYDFSRGYHPYEKPYLELLQ